MQERIKELAEQVGFEFNSLGGTYTSGTLVDNLDKFAELIIQECADIVADAVDHREPASTYVDKIKQHFGVEE